MPTLFISLLKVRVILESPIFYYVFLDAWCTIPTRLPSHRKSLSYITHRHPVFIFMASGGVFLLLILFKYIQTRRELKKWEVATYVDGRTTWRSFRLSDDENPNGLPRQQAQMSHARGIYDNWLLTRFSVAFVFALYVWPFCNPIAL